MSEVGWTSLQNKDFDAFFVRLEKNKKRYDLLVINYFKGDGYNKEEYVKFNNR